MAGEIIRPSALPDRSSPVASEKVPVDNGSSVGGATIEALVNAGRPLASQAEAEAGVQATKAMTPLTTKQAIYAQGDVRFAAAAQGALADTAVQPEDLGDLASKDTVSNADWSGVDLSVENGGTGASTASAARTALGLGTAATADTNDLATAAQGAKADTALQSIVQGANITVDDTDPLNPVITANAGGIADGSKGDIIVTSGGTVWSLNRQFDTVVDLLVDTAMSYSSGAGQVASGQRVTAQGYRYEVAASGASNHNVITAGGVKLHVQPCPDGAYSVWAFGASAVTDSTAIVQAAIEVASASPGYKTPVTLGGLSVYVTGEIFLKSNMILRDGTINWVPSANGMVCVNFGTKTGAYLVRVTGAENVVVDASTSTKDNIMGFNFGHLARSCFSSHCRAVMNNGAPSVSRNHIGFAISGILSVFETTGNRTNGSPVITAIPATGLMAAGMAINGTGIPGGATILSVDSATQITLSANATSTGTGGLLDVQRAAGAGAYQNVITDASAYYCGTSYYLETDGYGTSGWQAEMNANIVQGTCFSAVNKSLIVGYGARENNIQIRADNFVSQVGEATTVVVGLIRGAYNHVRIEEEIGTRADTQYTIQIDGNVCIYNSIEYSTQGIVTAAVLDSTTSPAVGKNIIKDIGTAQAMGGGELFAVAGYSSGAAGAITTINTVVPARKCVLVEARAFNWAVPASSTYLHFAKNGTRDTLQRLTWGSGDTTKARKSVKPDASAFTEIDSRFRYTKNDYIEVSIEQDASAANQVSYTLYFKFLE